MKLTKPQSSAMLALSCADGETFNQRDYEIETWESLVKYGLVRKEAIFYAGIGFADFKLTDKGRAWCEENFNKELREMIDARG